jgi:hypothetical protein
MTTAITMAASSHTGSIHVNRRGAGAAIEQVKVQPPPPPYAVVQAFGGAGVSDPYPDLYATLLITPLARVNKVLFLWACKGDSGSYWGGLAKETLAITGVGLQRRLWQLLGRRQRSPPGHVAGGQRRRPLHARATQRRGSLLPGIPRGLARLPAAARMRHTLGPPAPNSGGERSSSLLASRPP